MGKNSNRNDRARWQWWMVFVGAPISITLGTIGYWLSNGSIPNAAAWGDAFYRALQLLFMRMSPVETIHWTLEVARWLAALLFGLAAVLTIIGIFREEMKQIRLQIPWPRHVVILGVGPKTTRLVQCFRKQGRRVVVVSPAADAEGVAECCGRGVTLVSGVLAEPSTLIKARVYWASHVVALSDEDCTNLAVVEETRKLIMNRVPIGSGRFPVKCFAHLSDVDARTSLQASMAFGRDSRVEIRFFDLFDAAARRLLLDPKQMPLDHGGVGKDDVRQVQLVILGFGRMGRTVALRAAQHGHFANLKPLRISVVDRHAERRRQALLFRYPNFDKTCEIEFHEMQIESLAARQLLEKWCEDKSKVVSIAACFDRDSLALEVALRMKAKLDELHVPLFVRMANHAGFAALLQGGVAEPVSMVHAFGMIEDCCTDEYLEDPRNEKVAQSIHEDHRREKIADIEGRGGAPGKDISTRDRTELDDGLKDSNRQQADHIDIKLRVLGLERADIAKDPRPAVERIDEIELLAKMEHNRWNAERWLQGWTLGPSNKPKKITPYLVPWADLPDDIKLYDRNAVRIIPDILRTVGEKVCAAATTMRAGHPNR